MRIPKVQIIEKDGKKEFAVVSYDEFLKIQEKLEDYEDLRSLREAKEREKEAPTVRLADLRKELRRRAKRPGKSAKAKR